MDGIHVMFFPESNKETATKYMIAIEVPQALDRAVNIWLQYFFDHGCYYFGTTNTILKSDCVLCFSMECSTAMCSPWQNVR